MSLESGTNVLFLSKSDPYLTLHKYSDGKIKNEKGECLNADFWNFRIFLSGKLLLVIHNQFKPFLILNIVFNHVIFQNESTLRNVGEHPLGCICKNHFGQWRLNGRHWDGRAFSHQICFSHLSISLQEKLKWFQRFARK